MAFTFEHSNEGTGNTGVPTVDLTGIVPADGELVVIYIHSNQSTTEITHGGGEGTAFTRALHEVDPGDETATHAMFWKIAGASEPTDSYDFSTASQYWRIIMYVFSATGTIVVDSAAAAAISVTQQLYMNMTAQSGKTIATNAVSVVFGGKDTRETVEGNSEAYTDADNSYTGVLGNNFQQVTAGAYRIWVTGGSGPTNIRIDTADDDDNKNDVTYSMHISFVESGGSTVNTKTLISVLSATDGSPIQ